MIATATTRDCNPLDAWAAQRIGVATDRLTREAVREYQYGAIRQTVAWARAKSSFYAAQLAAFPADRPRSLDELALAPLTSPGDIVNQPHAFLCVPQSDISRVVTLETSGSTGPRKRIFFTAADQGLAAGFFASGVSAMAQPGDRMFIALPGEREGSVGFQLAQGVARSGVVPIPHGLVLDAGAALARMDQEKATLLIGLPVQVLALALKTGELARGAFRRLHTIVLCSDHVPRSLADRIRRATGCEIFEHYGSTEMGLGGGIDCYTHCGYHLREADLYFEIVSPQTGEPLADGQLGEVVFTTLSRVGMPLIRYRTGDLASILPGPCACGSPLRRLARIENRMGSAVPLGTIGNIAISALDEALFAVPGLHDFTATVVPGEPNELHLRVYAPNSSETIAAQAEGAVSSLPAIGDNIAAGKLRLIVVTQPGAFPVSGAKRKIEVLVP
jgi:phenylacetate-coenzyme A ligase PaaK-like adenylate-forming protein